MLTSASPPAGERDLAECVRIFTRQTRSMRSSTCRSSTGSRRRRRPHDGASTSRRWRAGRTATAVERPEPRGAGPRTRTSGTDVAVVRRPGPPALGPDTPNRDRRNALRQDGGRPRDGSRSREAGSSFRGETNRRRLADASRVRAAGVRTVSARIRYPPRMPSRIRRRSSRIPSAIPSIDGDASSGGSDVDVLHRSSQLLLELLQVHDDLAVAVGLADDDPANRPLLDPLVVSPAENLLVRALGARKQERGRDRPVHRGGGEVEARVLRERQAHRAVHRLELVRRALRQAEPTTSR